MKAPCATWQCDNRSADGNIYCDDCKDWIDKFGLKGETVAKALA